MTDHTHVTEDMLHAFVDGQLSDEDMQKVEAYLNENPERAIEISDWSSQNESIRALYPEPNQIFQIPDEKQPTRVPWMAIAASITLLWVGVGLGWYSKTVLTKDAHVFASVVSEAISAHAVYSIDPHRPVEVAASEEALLVRWLSKRVGSQLAAPDLRENGFELVGGRLLSVTDGPAAQFMYENKEGRRITLFAVKAANTQLASFTYQQDGDTGSFYWADENLKYAIIGKIKREQLNEIAVQVYNQLS